MNRLMFLSPHDFVYMTLVPLFMGLCIHEARRKARAMRLFMGDDLPVKTEFSKPWLRWETLRWGLCVSVMSLVVALARPGFWAEKSHSWMEGRDVLVLLDVSQSMAAEDLKPSRLEWAKAMLAAWSHRPGVNRMGLVVFANSPVFRCPLTWDTEFFRLVLNEVTVAPSASQGTEIASGLREAMRRLSALKDSQGQGIILVLTDGENHGPDPTPVLQEHETIALLWIFVGLGDSVQGERIPVLDEEGRRRYQRYQGHEVWSLMDASFLQQLAEATPRGVFLRAQGTPEEFAKGLEWNVERQQGRPLDYGAALTFRELFQIPILIGIFGLILDFCVLDQCVGKL